MKDLTYYIYYFEKVKVKAAAKYITKNNVGDNILPFVDYTGVVDRFISAFYESQFLDEFYGEKIESIEDYKSVDENTSYDDLCAILTYIIRGERFCTGKILTHIEDRLIHKLLVLLNNKM